MSPPPGAGAPPPSRPESRQRTSAPRTVGRSELARNPAFAELSPEVGELDLDALERALQADADATLTLVVEMARATDEGLRAAVRRLAPRLILDQTRRGTPRNRGVARPRRVPAHRGGDLDVDASMDAIVGARAEGRMPGLDELAARDWARPDLALCLVVDHSGSMNGARLTTAAVAGAACVLQAPEEHAVLAFAAGPTWLKRIDVAAPPTRSIERILALRGHGTTGLAGALHAAHLQLARARARRKVVLLLSDCRVTDEVDATQVARRLDELLILAPAGDDDEARRLARDSGARVLSLASMSDIPRVLNDLLGDDAR